jgi:hypothetical protein
MRGDRVEIVIDAGGTSRTYEVTAAKAGHRVEVVTGRGLVEVMEVTRGGTVVRTARFMSSRVLALVEHPAGREGEPEDARPAGKAGAARSAAAGPPARVPRGKPARAAGPAGMAPPAGARGTEPAEPAEPTGPAEAAEADEPAGSGEPGSMVEDAVDRTASQYG